MQSTARVAAVAAASYAAVLLVCERPGHPTGLQLALSYRARHADQLQQRLR